MTLGEVLIWDTRSRALQFCSKVLFEVRPESRKVKKSTENKSWVFKFAYNAHNELVVKTAFICTYKGEGMTIQRDYG